MDRQQHLLLLHISFFVSMYPIFASILEYRLFLNALTPFSDHAKWNFGVHTLQPKIQEIRTEGA